MNIYHDIILDFNERSYPVTVFAKQWDNNTRNIRITPLNNSIPLSLSEGITARIGLTKPDNHTVLNDATIKNGIIVVQLTKQMLAKPGRATAEIELYKEGNILSSQTFYLDIEPSAYNPNAPVSSDEYNSLSNLILSAESAIRDVEKIAKETKAAVENTEALAETIKGDEEQRVNAESVRESSEEQRVNAESERESSEEQRVQAELARVQAEEQRVNAESERESSEEQRVQAELARVQAEEQRVNAEISRQEALNSKADKAETETKIAELEAKINIATGGTDVDLTNYYTKSEIDATVQILENSVNSKADAQEVSEAIRNLQSQINAGVVEGSGNVDLSNYYTKTEVDNIVGAATTDLGFMQQKIDELETKNTNLEKDLDDCEKRISSVEIKILSWKDIQTFVRNGTIQNRLEIGDRFICQRNGETVEWIVVAFDVDIPIEEGLTHSMTLAMSTPCTTMAYDDDDSDYLTSDVRTYLNSNEFISGFDSDFTAVVGITDHFNCNDRFFLPTVPDMTGRYPYFSENSMIDENISYWINHATSDTTGLYIEDGFLSESVVSEEFPIITFCCVV